jgi:predicted phosphodiesterase
VKNAEELHQLFVQSNVDVVFTGHEHQFLFHQRDGIAYVISGGGGAPLYHEGGGDFYHFVRACCEPEQIELQVITLDRSIVARYHIPFK